MSELTFEEKQQKAIETLCEASRLIQQGRTYLLLAKRYKTMNGVEQKWVDKIAINLFDPIDEIESLKNVLKIAIK